MEVIRHPAQQKHDEYYAALAYSDTPLLSTATYGVYLQRTLQYMGGGRRLNAYKTLTSALEHMCGHYLIRSTSVATAEYLTAG